MNALSSFLSPIEELQKIITHESFDFPLLEFYKKFNLKWYPKVLNNL
jgi:hypothetical protein